MKNLSSIRNAGVALLFLLMLTVSQGLKAQIISSIAGTYSSSYYSGDGGPATAAQIGSPASVATDTAGNIYLTDNTNMVIRKIDASGIISTIAGNGTAGFSGDGGAATSAEINSPQGLCVDNAGNVYFADATNYRVRKIDASGIITTVAGTGTFGYTGDGAAATHAALNGVADVAVGPTGNLYIADGNSAIRMVNTSGIITTFAGSSVNGYSGDGGPATAAHLNAPTGIAVDAAGNVYVADNFNNVIRKINTSGIISTVVGNTGYGAGSGAGPSFGMGSGAYSGDGGAATNASLNQPNGIAVDRNGNLYIADMYNFVVRYVDAATATISTYAGNGTEGYSGDGGPATAAELNYYYSPTFAFSAYTSVDKNGNLFIADFGNDLIRKVVPYFPVVISTTTDTVCAETSVTYNLSTSASGTFHYHWTINGASVGSDAAPFVADSVHNGDTVMCVLTRAASTDTIGISNILVMTVNPRPDAGTISGAASECPTSVTTLTDGATGGTWSSSASGIASVSTTGAVTGVSAGSATISYSVVSTDGCGTAVATYSFNVLPAPYAGSISGTSTICAGGNTTLTESVTGGTWSSTPLSIATVDVSGIVYGVSAGSATVTYTVVNSCGTASTTFAMTVNPAVTGGTISGATNVCVGSNDTLSETVSGGTWTSSAPGTATVNASGIVTGIAGGSATITYTVSASCGTVFATYGVTVIAAPVSGAISGATSLCTGTTVTLSETVSGGTWSSSATGTATVDASGNVGGAASGIVTISYSVSNFCGTATATYTDTVNPGPSAGTISGATSVCAGSSTTLTDGAGSGTWSSSATGIATVDSSGNVTGVTSGAATISYSVTSACGTAVATYSFTVNPLPDAGTITGTSTICTGSSVALSTSGTSGTWSSSATGTATVDVAGNVGGAAAGTAVISYTATTVCGTATSTYTVTVNPGPSAGTITGTATVCAGATTTLSDTATGGTWTSGATGTATVDGSGNVGGVAAGTVAISYGITTACGTAYTTYSVTVNPLPVAGSVSGASSVCTGATTTVTDAAGGGTWSSSATAVATVDASGVVYGVTTGSTNIVYTVTNTCGTVSASLSETVITAPTAGTISGGALVCFGASITLTDGVSGGAWTSSAAGTATVDAGGNVTGVSGGTVYITYTVTNACGSAYTVDTLTVGVTPSVGVISGSSTLCTSTTITLTDGISGGTWTSSASGVASIDPASGVVTGIAAGTATITYTITNACGSAATLHALTVNAIPSAGTITGTTSVCPRVTTTLIDTTSGGSWTSGATGVATVSVTGVVTGVSAGSAIISYAVCGVCGTGYATATITVNPDPYAGMVTGVRDSVCIGSSIVLTDSAAGGVWMSGSTSVATVDSVGLVTGVSADTADIYYAVTNVCGTVSAAIRITVNAYPMAGSITGATHICVGGFTAISSSIASDLWSSSNTSVATVSSGGIVTAVAPGIDTIFHNFMNSCGTTFAYMIDTIDGRLTAGMLGTGDSVCQGDTINLSISLSGGSWSTSNAMATVTASGMIIGVAPGIDTITYTLVNTCGTSSVSVPLTVRSAGSCGSAVPVVTGNGAATFNLFPNPNQGTFTVQLTATPGQEVAFIITNMVGEKIKEMTLAGNKETEVQLAAPAGIYFLSAVIDGEKVTRKIVIQ